MKIWMGTPTSESEVCLEDEINDNTGFDGGCELQIHTYCCGGNLEKSEDCQHDTSLPHAQIQG